MLVGIYGSHGQYTAIVRSIIEGTVVAEVTSEGLDARVGDRIEFFQGSLEIPAQEQFPLYVIGDETL